MPSVPERKTPGDDEALKRRRSRTEVKRLTEEQSGTSLYLLWNHLRRGRRLWTRHCLHRSSDTHVGSAGSGSPKTLTSRSSMVVLAQSIEHDGKHALSRASGAPGEVTAMPWAMRRMCLRRRPGPDRAAA